MSAPPFVLVLSEAEVKGRWLRLGEDGGIETGRKPVHGPRKALAKKKVAGYIFKQKQVQSRETLRSGRK